MSGYRFQILIELQDNGESQTIQNIVKRVDDFMKKYVDETGVKIISSSCKFEPNNVELTFFDQEGPYTSFILFFEEQGFLKYVCIIDLVNNATDLIMQDGFFDKLITSLNNYFKIWQAVFMCDPYYKTHEQVFEDISKGINKENLGVRKYVTLRQ